MRRRLPAHIGVTIGSWRRRIQQVHGRQIGVNRAGLGLFSRLWLRAPLAGLFLGGLGLLFPPRHFLHVRHHRRSSPRRLPAANGSRHQASLMRRPVLDVCPGQGEDKVQEEQEQDNQDQGADYWSEPLHEQHSQCPSYVAASAALLSRQPGLISAHADHERRMTGYQYDQQQKLDCHHCTRAQWQPLVESGPQQAQPYHSQAQGHGKSYPAKGLTHNAHPPAQDRARRDAQQAQKGHNCEQKQAQADESGAALAPVSTSAARASPAAADQRMVASWPCFDAGGPCSTLRPDDVLRRAHDAGSIPGAVWPDLRSAPAPEQGLLRAPRSAGERNCPRPVRRCG